jgi:hypothetical protein
MASVARWRALITLIFVALAGPQGTLLVSAVEHFTSDAAQEPDCQASMCKTRQCCCGSNSENGCQIGASRCSSSDTVLPAIAKGVLPSRLSAALPCERAGTLVTACAGNVDDGFDRRHERPPRASS